MCSYLEYCPCIWFSLDYFCAFLLFCCFLTDIFYFYDFYYYYFVCISGEILQFDILYVFFFIRTQISWASTTSRSTRPTVPSCRSWTPWRTALVTTSHSSASSLTPTGSRRYRPMSWLTGKRSGSVMTRPRLMMNMKASQSFAVVEVGPVCCVHSFNWCIASDDGPPNLLEIGKSVV